VLVEGNHEYRLDRWAAATAEGRGAYSMLAPRIQLAKGRAKFTYIRYGSVDGRYPHHALNARIIAVHGWSYAGTRQRTTSRSVRARASSTATRIGRRQHHSEHLLPGRVIQARSAGCLCKPIPLYGTGRPVEWVNALSSVPGPAQRHALYHPDHGQSLHPAGWRGVAA